jgi:hypothetical protein
MATRLDTGNIQLRQPGSVPMRQIEPRPVQYIAGRAQAESNQVMGQMLDRMSAGLFEYAGKMRIEEGLKYAAENPITQEQLIDSQGGIDLNIGGGVTIKNGKVEKSVASMLPSKFNEAVMKARSAQLSNLFEQQGTAELVKMLSDIERGDPSASSKNIIEKINTFTKANTEVLSQVDPAAAIRFNATMAAHGNSVYKSALEAESKFNKRLRETEFDSLYNNEITILQNHAKNNPAELAIIGEASLGRLRQAALTKGIGLEMSNKYINDFQKDFREVQINVIKQELRKEDYMRDVAKTRSDILAGNLGKLSPVLQNLQLDSKAIEDISKEFNTLVSYRRQDQQYAEKAKKEADHKTTSNMLLTYHDPKTSAQQKRQIAVELTKMGVLSIEQIEHFLKPETKEGDPYAYAALENQIVFGDITDSNQLKKLSQRTGMSGTQFARLNSRLLDGVKKDETDARRLIRRFAGTPDVVSSFATKDDEAKINKELSIVSYYENNIKEFRKANPGIEVPYNDLALKAKQKYEEIDKADITKNAARKSIEGITASLIESKKLPPGAVIDESTNIDDLKTKYKLKDGDVDILKKKQNILKGIK